VIKYTKSRRFQVHGEHRQTANDLYFPLWFLERFLFEWRETIFLFQGLKEEGKEFGIRMCD
jgi:hypothetical protein